jgi:hypothetical protein
VPTGPSDMADRQAGKLHSKRRFSLKIPTSIFLGEEVDETGRGESPFLSPANSDCSSALPDCWRISDRKE